MYLYQCGLYLVNGSEDKSAEKAFLLTLVTLKISSKVMITFGTSLDSDNNRRTWIKKNR